jgi:hypothetical protein
MRIFFAGKAEQRFAARRIFRTPQPKTCGERRPAEKGHLWIDLEAISK